jgi:DNA-binding transcriptional regulator GbsR (MarR family)|tara:strand:+ start:1786 stop:2169 length:384 start_codon:yes stop_codon:yes gene_type:complete
MGDNITFIDTWYAFCEFRMNLFQYLKSHGIRETFYKFKERLKTYENLSHRIKNVETYENMHRAIDSNLKMSINIARGRSILEETNEEIAKARKWAQKSHEDYYQVANRKIKKLEQERIWALTNSLIF